MRKSTALLISRNVILYPLVPEMIVLHPSYVAYPRLSSRHGPPKIIVKKEPPSSPPTGPPTARRRPRNLDLSSSNTNTSSSRPSAPLTARDSGGLAMHDVGLACLSPGFQTQDPMMREQLQRSISVRDQQRHIIESRLQKTAKPSDPDALRSSEQNPGFGSGLKTPSRKRPPPAGLSIVPPSHEQFANERVIQSAPLNQSFTGRHQPHHPMTRQVENRPHNLSNTSHIHHVPATQTTNTLPSISDVFAGDNLAPRGQPSSRPAGLLPSNSNSNSSHSNHPPPFPSPGLPPPSSHPPPTSRGREHRSAEEAINEMTGGREDLLPKIVHYSGNGQRSQHLQQHPPTPPSPISGPGPHAQYAVKHAGPPTAIAVHGDGAIKSGGARRRQRVEYERDNGSPPLGSGPDFPRRGPFGEGVDSPETGRRKKEEFMGLCARAWDLFHS